MIGCFEHLNNIQPKTDPDEQRRAVEDLIKRLTPDRAKQFSVNIGRNEGYKIDYFSVRSSSFKAEIK